MKKCLKCLLPLEILTASYGLHQECFATWFEVSPAAQFTSLTRKSVTTSDLLSSNQQNTSFFHGKFKKYSAQLEGSSYILKMREPEAPELPEVEYLCNQIGKMLGIPVADFYIIDFEEDIVFVTKNFIKATTPTDLQHIYHFRADHEHSCEGLIHIVAEKTKRPYDVKILINTILFDALIGNHDRHGRNLAFVINSNNISLSPIYDNVSYLSLEKGNMLRADFNPTGKISTQVTFEPSMRDYVIELKRLGYHEDVAAFYSNIKWPQITQIIENSFCSDLMRKAIMGLIQKRFEEIKDEL